MRATIVAFLLMALQAAPPVPRKTANNTASSPATIHKKADSNKNVPSAAPIQTQPASPPNNQERANPTAESEPRHVIIDGNPGKDAWDKVYIVLTGLLVLIGGITFVAVWYQAKKTAEAAKAAADSVAAINKQAGIMERQTRATEIAADAARENVEVVINRERARLSVELHPFRKPDADRDGFRPMAPETPITFRISFSGSSNAFNVGVTSGATVVDSPGKNMDWDVGRILDAPATITPDTRLGRYDAIVLPKQLSDSDFDDVRNGKQFVRFFGRVTYRDVFGKDRETVWHRVWKPLMALEGRGEWEKIGPPEANRET